MNPILYKEESYRIIGSCIEVHNELGPGLLEILYKDALEIEFSASNIPYEREKKYQVFYKKKLLPHYYYADFILFGCITLEVKAVNELRPEFQKYTLNYMRLSKCKLGIIANFGTSSFESKRLIL